MQPARLKCPIGLHKIDKAGKGEDEIFLHRESQFMLPKIVNFIFCHKTFN